MVQRKEKNGIRTNHSIKKNLDDEYTRGVPSEMIASLVTISYEVIETLGSKKQKKKKKPDSSKNPSSHYFYKYLRVTVDPCRHSLDKKGLWGLYKTDEKGPDEEILEGFKNLFNTDFDIDFVYHHYPSNVGDSSPILYWRCLQAFERWKQRLSKNYIHNDDNENDDNENDNDDEYGNKVDGPIDHHQVPDKRYLHVVMIECKGLLNHLLSKKDESYHLRRVDPPSTFSPTSGCQCAACSVHPGKKSLSKGKGIKNKITNRQRKELFL